VSVWTRPSFCDCSWGNPKAKPGFVERLIHAHYLNEADGMATFEKAAAKLPKVVIPKRI
jgi:hypothetical protein